MRPGVLLVVNFDAFTYGYYANDALERREIPTQGRYHRWLITFRPTAWWRETPEPASAGSTAYRASSFLPAKNPAKKSVGNCVFAIQRGMQIPFCHELSSLSQERSVL
jgi:hypothetical protein